MKRRKWMAAGLAAVMVLSLAACGGGSNSGGSGETTAASGGGGTETKAEASGGSADGKIEITFWHAMGGVNGEATEAVVKAFNESQDEIVVKSEYQGTYDDMITKLKATMQSGGMPDVCQMYDIGTKFMTDSGFAIPVQDMFETTGFDPSCVMDIITSYYTVDGKQMSMPFNVSTPMLYYNKDAFKAAGLDPDTPPKNFDEVMEFSKQIVESGAAPVGYAQAIYGWFFEQQIAGQGQYYADNENGRKAAATAVEFDKNGTGLKIFETWKNLLDSGYAANYGSTTADTQTAFFAGQAAIIVESTAILRNAVNSSAFEVGTGYFPKIGDNAEGGVIIGGASLWMMDNKDDAKKDAAWKFIEFTTTPEVQATWSMSTGYFAINPAAYETEEMKAFIAENPNFMTAINQLNDAPVNGYTAGVLSGVATEARILFNEAMEKTYNGEYTPQEAVDFLAESVNSAIENYNASTQ
jgi:sn-glycerol 3-phosphate transport system substrate-binding protein